MLQDVIVSAHAQGAVSAPVFPVAKPSASLLPSAYLPPTREGKKEVWCITGAPSPGPLSLSPPLLRRANDLTQFAVGDSSRSFLLYRPVLSYRTRDLIGLKDDDILRRGQQKAGRSCQGLVEVLRRYGDIVGFMEIRISRRSTRIELGWTKPDQKGGKSSAACKEELRHYNKPQS